MTPKEDQQPMTTREELVWPWGFESAETSSGPMFSVYDNRGHRLTEPYIEEGAARLIAAAPKLLAALEACQSALATIVDPKAIKSTSVMYAFAHAQEAEAKARSAITTALGNSYERCSEAGGPNSRST